VGVKWLANELKLEAGTLSHGIWKVGVHMKNDRTLQQKWKLLQN
jgi:hypothetical protein